MGTARAAHLTSSAGGPHGPMAMGHPRASRGDHRTGRMGGRGGGAALGTMVAPSLLLTTQDVAATPEEALGRVVVVSLPWRAAGFRVRLHPAAGFVTSPALGWTLARVDRRGLPSMRLGQLPGMSLPTRRGAPGSDAWRWRWVEGPRLVADVELRLRVLGGQGQSMRRDLGM
jgi:hypothetical protein